MQKKVTWGVLGAAKIALKQVIPAMQGSEYAQIVAIASRDLRKAEAAAKELGIAAAYGSYEELLADATINAIYNPLPNHLHVPWSIKALEAGKHVLCEKPIALSAAEAEQLLAASQQYPHLKIMEAFMYRLHPQWRRAKELVADGKIGTLKTIQSFFSYSNADPQDIRNRADFGGGGLMDIGCYCISLSRFLFGAEPERVCGLVEYDPQLKIDRLSSAMLDFGSGTATFTCSTQLTPYQRVNLFGTSGRIEIEIPFNAPPDRPCRMWHTNVGPDGDDRCEEILLEVCNQYEIQGNLFSRAVLEDLPVPTPFEDAIQNMRVIERIKQSAQSATFL